MDVLQRTSRALHLPVPRPCGNDFVAGHDLAIIPEVFLLCPCPAASRPRLRDHQVRIELVRVLVHEAGHAVVALATGRRLDGIRLHTDTSGLTVSSGRPRGPGMIATAGAGYLAPSVLGLAALSLVRADHTAWALYGVLAVLAGMLVFIRNGWGLVVVGLSGLAAAALTYRAPDAVHQVD